MHGEENIGYGGRADLNKRIITNGDIIMSFQNFEKALDLAKQCENYEIGRGKSDKVISRGEKLMGFKFSKQNYEFFKRIGYLNFEINEVYGISTDDFSDKMEGSAIEDTLRDRKKYSLPKNWLYIYNFGYDGWKAFLDYGNLNAEGEPPVIVSVCTGKEWLGAKESAKGKWKHIKDRNFLEVGIFAEDLGDFILCLVEEAIERQK